MTTRVLRSPADIDALGRFIAARSKYPLTVTISQGATRTALQNRLYHRWMADISRQLGDQTPDEVRAECKLTHGIPIICAENEAYRVQYDRTIGALPYAQRLEAVRVLDYPVTRLMTTKQQSAMMDAIQRHWAQRGVRLTDPDALKYDEEFGPMVTA